jgi:hypothetical protein
MRRDAEIELRVNAGRGLATLRFRRSQLESGASEQELARVLSDAGLGPFAERAARALLQKVRNRADQETSPRYVTLPTELEKTPTGISLPPARKNRLIGEWERRQEKERYKGLAEAEVAILVFIVSNELNEKGEDFEITIREYLQLLEGKYPKGKIEVAGVALGTKPRETLSQNDAFSQLRAMRGKITGGVGESTGFWGYDQVHILGHGDVGRGLLFKGGKAFDPDLFGYAARDAVPLKAGGKVVIAACYGSGGELAGWLRTTLDKAEAERSRVHAVEGYFATASEETIPGSKKYELKWSAHPSTKDIEIFLDRKPDE